MLKDVKFCGVANDIEQHFHWKITEFSGETLFHIWLDSDRNTVFTFKITFNQGWLKKSISFDISRSLFHLDTFDILKEFHQSARERGWSLGYFCFPIASTIPLDLALNLVHLPKRLRLKLFWWYLFAV